MWRQVVAHWVCRVNAVAGDPVDVPVQNIPPAAGQGARPAAALAFRPPPCIARRTAPILLESRRTSPLSPTARWRVIRGIRVKIVAELRDKFAAAALKWPDTGLQLPAR
jgi:hypothetical protein